jgi:hypothetical protein
MSVTRLRLLFSDASFECHLDQVAHRWAFGKLVHALLTQQKLVMQVNGEKEGFWVSWRPDAGLALHSRLGLHPQDLLQYVVDGRLVIMC